MVANFPRIVSIDNIIMVSNLPRIVIIENIIMVAPSSCLSNNDMKSSSDISITQIKVTSDDRVPLNLQLQANGFYILSVQRCSFVNCATAKVHKLIALHIYKLVKQILVREVLYSEYYKIIFDPLHGYLNSAKYVIMSITQCR